MIIFSDGMFSTIPQLKLEHHNSLILFQLEKQQMQISENKDDWVEELILFIIRYYNYNNYYEE